MNQRFTMGRPCGEAAPSAGDRAPSGLTSVHAMIESSLLAAEQTVNMASGYSRVATEFLLYFMLTKKRTIGY